MSEPRRVVLPIPPSTNNLFRNLPGRGRVKSGDYKEWLRAAGCVLALQPAWKVPGPVRLAIVLPLKMRGDISNRIKAIEDLLVEQGRIDDDRNVHGLTVLRGDAAVGTARVEIAPA